MTRALHAETGPRMQRYPKPLAAKSTFIKMVMVLWIVCPHTIMGKLIRDDVIVEKPIEVEYHNESTLNLRDGEEMLTGIASSKLERYFH